MDVQPRASRIAAAIGEPARARMLYCLMDNRARTATELAVIAGVSPSTASVHLHRLAHERLVKLEAQGRYRYYSLHGPAVARALESLGVLAGASRAKKFVPSTPHRLRAARTCYDHLAGGLGVALHDRLKSLAWLSDSYSLTPAGAKALAALGVDVEAARASRRCFAFPCLDWSERRSHLGGAIGAALLALTLKKRWLLQDLDARSLTLTPHGRREFQARFGLALPF